MANYKVGYGKPPKHSQFQPGQSGNSSGRPKGSVSTAQLLDKHLATLVTVNTGGKLKKLSKREALVMSLIADALKGNERTRKAFIDLILTLDEKKPQHQPEAMDLEGDQAVIDALLYSYGVKGKAAYNTTGNKPKSTKNIKKHIGADKP